MALPTLHSPPQIARLRSACRLVAEVLVETAAHVRPGITTAALDEIAASALHHRDAVSAMRELPYFTGAICVSPNEVACHGVPGARELAEGDIVNLDIAARFPGRFGYYGDTSATYFVGEPSPAVRHLVETARRALAAGIAAVQPGRPLCEVGDAIESLALEEGCRVVKGYRGHGIGRVLHGAPAVPHHAGSGSIVEMVPGLAFTLEPILVRGGAAVRCLEDRWTVVTLDGGFAAQFEHTVVVTEAGHEVLTCLGS